MKRFLKEMIGIMGLTILADKVEEIIQYLDLDGKDDYSKIFAIYNYVCQNVEYDWAVP